jgi:hypothetical protein
MMHALQILVYSVTLISAACAMEPDADFFLKLLESKDAKPDDSAAFAFYGRSLGDEVHFSAEGGISSEGGGTTWGTLVRRRIVEGGYLVESTVRTHPESVKKGAMPVPIIVTWFDKVAFPRVAWRRSIITERDGKAVVLERWKGVMWFSASKPKLQWTRYAAFQESRGGTPSDRRAPQIRKVGDFIGTAMEDLNPKGFPTVITIEPDGEGLEVWKEMRWK